METSSPGRRGTWPPGIRLLWPGLALALVMPAALRAEEGASADRKLVVTNHALNQFVRKLDGQWQGLRVASDGNVYFAGGSHSPDVGAPFFRYDPATRRLKMLCQDITAICGEDPSKTPPQGKIHSDILEYKGWLYFGTHLSDYSEKGRATYPGGHLIGYEMATEKFRDFGVIHRNYTNYAGVGLDAGRGRIYFWATPFFEGDGAHLYRIDIASGAKEDLGLAASWINKGEHGPPSYDFFVDGRGDCWFTYRDNPALHVARAGTGRIEHFPDAMPAGTTGRRGADIWYRGAAIDENRALIAMEKGLWIFDSRKAGGRDCPFILCRAAPAKQHNSFVAIDAGRFYWTVPEKGGGIRIWSSDLNDPSDAKTVDHGLLVDTEGRTPFFLGDMASAGKGQLYLVGRWNARDCDMDTIGILRHGTKLAVMFSVVDVSKDLEAK